MLESSPGELSARAGAARIIRGLATALLLGLAPSAGAAPEPAADPVFIDMILNKCGNDVQQEKNKAPGLLTTPKLIHIGGVDGTLIKVYYDPTSAKLPEREQALIKAVQMVMAYGFKLPPVMDVYLTPSSVEGNAARGVTYAGYPHPSLVVPTFCAKLTTADGGVAVIQPPRTLGDAEYHKAFDAKHAAHPWTLKACDKEARDAGKAALCQATLAHELCHVLHNVQNLGQAIYSSLTHIATAANGGWDVQAPKISTYAGKNRIEFVAEVCAGLVYGKTYDDDVMAAYHDLGGPDPGVSPQPIPNPNP